MAKLTTALGLLFSRAISSPAPAVTEASSDAAVQNAIADHNLHAAGVALNALVQARLPAKAPAHPDAVLDRAFVDYHAARGILAPAVPILKRVIADPQTPNRAHYQLLLASFAEASGSFDDADRQYRSISRDAKAGPDNARAAALGIARLQLASDPSAALTTLSGIDRTSVPQSDIWEVDLLIARASSMARADNGAQVAAALDRAWAEAAYAPLVAGAPARVAGDRAVAAGRTGDRKTLVTMLAVDRANRNPNNGQNALAADLPICGTDGIGVQDRVIIDVASLPAVGRPAISLVWATRPGIGRPFLAAAARSGTLSVTDGRSGNFELACRTAPSIDFAVRNSLDESTIAWMTGRGVYPLEESDDGVSTTGLASMLAAREARYGATSLMLLPVLMRVMAGEAVDLGAGDQDTRKQIAETVARIGSVLTQNNAPPELAVLWQMSSIGSAVMAQTKTASDGQNEVQALLVKAAGDPNISPDMIYTLATSTTQMPNVPSNFSAAMLGSTLNLLTRSAPANDQRTAAIALRLYRLRMSLDDKTGAAEAIKPLGLAKDLCVRADPPTHMVSSNISSDDYPGDLVFTSMRGRTSIEFDLDLSGQARDGRVLVSDPPMAFDPITMSRIPTIHYEPARFAGGPSTCRGENQSVVWQMPY
jgi:hypothetical protein